MLGAGDLDERMTFESRETADDGYGNERSEWVARFSRRAEVIPLKGGEDVIASRLEGRQPVIIRVRWDSQTLAITPEWRAVDRSGVVYALKTATDMERQRQHITMMAEAGVAS